MSAQEDREKDNPQDSPSGTSFDIEKIIDIDSVSVPYIFPTDLRDTFLLTHTTADRFYQHYDPARRQVYDDIHLGIPGSATRSVVWGPEFVRGNQPGIEPLNRYRLHLRPIREYLFDGAVANLLFLRGSDQDDYFFQANFGLRLARDIRFCIDYERLPQIGDYRNQRLRNTSANFVLSKVWKDSILTSHFIFSGTDIIHENNGGVSTDDIQSNPIFNLRANVPVFLLNSETISKDRVFILQHRLKVLRIGRFKSFLEHQLQVQNHRFRYAHSLSESEIDTSYYGSFSQYFDRGFRHAFTYRSLGNEIRVGSLLQEWKWISSLHWKMGLAFNNVRWNPEYNAQVFNETFLFAEGAFNIAHKIKSYAKYQAGFFSAANNTSFIYHGTVDISKNWYLSGEYQRFRNLPPLISRSIGVNFQQAYDRNWKDIRVNQWEIMVGHQPGKAQVGFAYFRVLDWIYFDQHGFPQQLQNPANMVQFKMNHWFAVKPLFLDYSLVINQSLTLELGGVPVFVKASLYYDGALLGKASKFRLGIDFRYIKPGPNISFMPLHAQWILLSEALEKDFLEADIFAAMRVKVFKAFVRFENLINALTGNIGFVHGRYPMQDAGLRLGFQWIFVN